MAGERGAQFQTPATSRRGALRPLNVNPTTGGVLLVRPAAAAAGGWAE